MKVGIVGLPFVGKTTIFNALTRSDAETGNYAASQSSNVSSVQVPDPRLTKLAELFEPKKVTPTTIDYIDVAGLSKGDSERIGFEASFLADLREVDALAQVVRVFEDESVPHIDGSIDPIRDIETIELEFAVADLKIIEKRIERIERDLRVQNNADLQNQLEVLRKCEESLQDGTAIRELNFSEAEEKMIRGYQFLSQKPLLIILNIAEDEIERVEKIEGVFSSYAERSETEIFALSARLEMEIAQLDSDESAIFQEEMGLPEPALSRFIQVSYRLLGLITFLTAGGPNEVRAWTLPKGSTAIEAAGTIHSDLARGFIRAETIFWQDLVQLGGFSEAKSTGKLRLEGKEYTVQDGDVLTIRFNV